MNDRPSSVSDSTPNSSVFLLSNPAKVIWRMMPGHWSSSASDSPVPVNATTFSPAYVEVSCVSLPISTSHRKPLLWRPPVASTNFKR